VVYEGYRDKDKRKEYMKEWARKQRVLYPKKCRGYRREYDQNHKEQIAEREREWRRENPDYKLRNREYNKRNPEKVKAHNLVHDKRISTFIPLGLECELCPEDDKRTEKLERHHPDYDYPEIIVTCCKECHENIIQNG